MHTIFHTKYVDPQGYWFDVIKVDENKFLIFNLSVGIKNKKLTYCS